MPDARWVGAVVLCAIVALIVFRIASDSAIWLGEWSYAIEDGSVVARVRSRLRVPLPVRRIRFSTIARVDRTSGPGPDGITLPFRFGRKRLLGSGGTANTVDLVRRRPWQPLVVLTPADPDAFALELRLALANDRASRDREPSAWYTRQS